MLADIEAGKVATVIVKDMSRLGRNYLQVGMYTEMIFPQKGVRFIAINDGVDSAQGDNDFAPLRNIFNEWLVRDTGKKIKVVKRSKGMSGKPVGKDLRVGLIVEVEAADQGFYFFIRESRGDLTDNGIGAAVGTAVEDHKTVRCVEDKTLFVGEGIRSPAPFFLQVHVLPDAFFLQSRSLMRDQINPVPRGKVPGDELDPVRILF